MPCVSLKTAKAISRLIGWIDTRKVWWFSEARAKKKCGGQHPAGEHGFVLADAQVLKNPDSRPQPELFLAGKVFPAYRFDELVRSCLLLFSQKELLPNEGSEVLHAVVLAYAHASSEIGGMVEVEAVLAPLLDK